MLYTFKMTRSLLPNGNISTLRGEENKSFKMDLLPIVSGKEQNTPFFPLELYHRENFEKILSG